MWNQQRADRATIQQRRRLLKSCGHRRDRGEVSGPDHRFILRADVPGVAREDIDISMEDGILTIAGERQTAKHEEAVGVKRFERVSGRFYRRFTLPETADAEGIAARSANGILEVTIPKLPEVQPRRITVEAA
mgnify:CR=1 FL=1